jgi:transcriptional regulator GlxA family with amidase domain
MANQTGGRGQKSNDRVLSIGFVLADNFTLSPFSLFVDQLRLAADEGDRGRPIRCRWSVMSSTAEPVRASCGLTIGSLSPLTDPRQFDYIVVVGGVLHAGPQIGPQVITYLRTAAQLGVPLVGICTGSFILCRAGLMKGYRCCVSWFHYQDFLEEFPHHHPIADRLSVVDRDRITSSGGVGAADLAAYLIERYLGRSAAQKSSQVLLMERARSGNSAQPLPPMAGPPVNERVRRAILLMEENVARPISIALIAERLRVSSRQLERLFQISMGVRPALFYREMRLKYAHWHLCNSPRSITNIAIDTGFSDCAHFARQFKVKYKLTPSQFRAKAKSDPLPGREADRRFVRKGELAAGRVF